MENKVGAVIPSEKEMARLGKQLSAMAARISRFTIVLDSTQRRRTLKFRPGGERVVETVGKLAGKVGVDVPQAPFAGVQADLKLAQRLRPFERALSTLQQAVRDTILQAESECWSGATAYYSALAQLARTNPELAADMKQVMEFFASGRRKESVAGAKDEAALDAADGDRAA